MCVHSLIKLMPREKKRPTQFAVEAKHKNLDREDADDGEEESNPWIKAFLDDLTDQSKPKSRRNIVATNGALAKAIAAAKALEDDVNKNDKKKKRKHKSNNSNEDDDDDDDVKEGNKATNSTCINKKKKKKKKVEITTDSSNKKKKLVKVVNPEMIAVDDGSDDNLFEQIN